MDRRNSSKGARGAATMMVHAVRDLGGGIYHGLTGVVVEPYRKAKVTAALVCVVVGSLQMIFRVLFCLVSFLEATTGAMVFIVKRCAVAAQGGRRG